MEAKVTGLDELIQKMNRYPRVFERVMKATMTAVLLKIWEKVPPYPAARPDSSYRRTGTLGRSLGTSMQGTKMGQPGIMRIKKMGAGDFSATFGTRLKYAPDVIGENQKPAFAGRWWTLKGVARGAERDVIKIFEASAAAMARWLSSNAGAEPTGPTEFRI